MMQNQQKLVYGVGIVDVPHGSGDVAFTGKSSRNPFYVRWRGMIQRCYCPRFQQKTPSYAGCTVDPLWHRFSEFFSWMRTQNWQGNQLDKDLLGGGKLYSPETCLFVPQQINLFLTDARAIRGEYPVGVRLHQGGRYNARISVGDRMIHLGFFDTPQEAALAWAQAKAARAIELAREQTDPRVAEGLHRYVARLIDNTMGIT